MARAFKLLRYTAGGMPTTAVGTCTPLPKNKHTPSKGSTFLRMPGAPELETCSTAEKIVTAYARLIITRHSGAARRGRIK
jgi:hypothetical protein